MAASGACSLCSAASSPVWRRDKASGEKICNRCYRNPSSREASDGLSAENLFKDLTLTEAPDGEDKAHRKRKHREHGTGEAAQPDAMDLSTPAVESDTEYPAIDLQAVPHKLQVLCSGSSKLDGAYSRLEGPSRGRPCYAKWSERKPMYLFWNKKWILGWDFGSTKSYAQLKDVSGVLCPCEPYPKVWKVLEKHKGDGAEDDPEKSKRQYKDNLAMRLVDAAVLDLPEEEKILGGSIQQLPRQEGRTSRKSRREAVRTKPDRGAATGEGAPAAKSDVAARADEDKAEQDALKAAASSSDEERKVGESAQESGEDSDSDSSESSSSETESQQPNSAERSKERPIEASQLKETPERKALALESKLKSELMKLPGALARQKKLRTVRDMLLKQANDTNGVNGVAPERLQAVLRNVESWLAHSAPPLPTPSAAKAPAAAPVPAKAPAPTPAPGPTQEPLASTAAPLRSALRRPGAPRQPSRRIGFQEGQSLVREVQVESHRSLGEVLWFYLPGSRVVCDACEKEVLQSMGSLQGAPNQSQFAQCRFHCIDCSGL